MTNEQRKSVIGFLEKKQSILEMMEDPNCGDSMHKTLEIKLQKYKAKIKELVCATP